MADEQDIVEIMRPAIRKARNSENFCGLCDRWPRGVIHCSCEEMARAALSALTAAGYTITPPDDLCRELRELAHKIHAAAIWTERNRK